MTYAGTSEGKDHTVSDWYRDFANSGFGATITKQLGLPRPALTPPGLRRESDSRAGHVGLSLNGTLAPWQWSFTGNLDRNASETETQTSTGTDHSHSVNQSGSAELVMNGPVRYWGSSTTVVTTNQSPATG